MPVEHTPDQAEEALERVLGRLYACLELDAAPVIKFPDRPFRVAGSLDADQLAAMRLLTTVLAEYFEEHEADRQDLEHRRARLSGVAAGRELVMVGQPIMDLATGETVGVEALARFPTLDQGPGEVFDEAWQLGVGLELELAAVDAAIALFGRLSDDAYLAVNVAPTTLADDRFLERAQALPPGRLVMEVTEHAVIDDYARVNLAARRLREAGVRFAVDDVGSGFSGLERILRLNPDILKIDKALVHDIDTRSPCYAMVAALRVFAAEVGATLVAEGIETGSERATLCGLGVGDGQGFYLAVPRELG